MREIEFINTLVPYGELLVGIGLLIGCFTKTAVFFRIMMNSSYMFSDTTSTNPQRVLLSMCILVSAMNAGRYGIDGMIMPSIKEKLFANKTKKRRCLISSTYTLKEKTTHYEWFFSLTELLLMVFLYVYVNKNRTSIVCTGGVGNE